MDSKEGFPEMLKIVCSIMSRPESVAFREPVDWEGLGLFDYLEIVSTPMDLGTIKKKIESVYYNSVEVFRIRAGVLSTITHDIFSLMLKGNC